MPSSSEQSLEQNQNVIISQGISSKAFISYSTHTNRHHAAKTQPPWGEVIKEMKQHWDEVVINLNDQQFILKP